ncbi:MAG TPA: Hsp20/alpha crystallin family protein [Rhodocyclaceae bacterium]
MANITRMSPFRAMERFSPFEELERMLEGMRMRPLAGAAGFGDVRLEVSEDDKCYTVKAEMPGVAKDDIKVSIDNNQVTISAEVKQEQKTGESHNMLCAERFYGQMFRGFTLESAVDDAKADAKYENGILTLTLPKKAGAGSHKLTVH